MAMSKIPPSLMGLQSAINPNDEDPLGTNLKAQGMASYYDEARKSDPRFASGPLPDPAWEGLFQALANRGVNKVGQEAVQPGATSGSVVDGPYGPATNVQDPNTLSGQDLENARLMRSNSIAQTPQFRGKMKR